MNQPILPNWTRLPERAALTAVGTSLLAMSIIGGMAPTLAHAEQPPPPCFPNPQAAQDVATVLSRGDAIQLPGPLRDALARLADRPHSQLPLQIFAEANSPSQLFQYYLLDTNGFE